MCKKVSAKKEGIVCKGILSLAGDFWYFSSSRKVRIHRGEAKARLCNYTFSFHINLFKSKNTSRRAFLPSRWHWHLWDRKIYLFLVFVYLQYHTNIARTRSFSKRLALDCRQALKGYVWKGKSLSATFGYFSVVGKVRISGVGLCLDAVPELLDRVKSSKPAPQGALPLAVTPRLVSTYFLIISICNFPQI